MKVKAAEKCSNTLDYLLRRRSVLAKKMSGPGPSKEEINAILTAAARVPDHGKMFPWYFIVLSGGQREKAGALLKKAYKAENPDASNAKLELEAEKFTQAPVVIFVVSRIRRGKRPAWEQILSAGAACQNLCLAANAAGYGANWLTQWYSYSDQFKKDLGLEQQDNIAGVIYIGTPTEPPAERDRAALDKIVTYWDADESLNKGADYDNDEKQWPDQGFDIPEN